MPPPARLQSDDGFALVWDHWLLDTLSSWERQPAGVYAVPADELDSADGEAEAATAGAPGRPAEVPQAGGAIHSILSDVSRQQSSPPRAAGDGGGAHPPCKRPRVDQEQHAAQNLPQMHQLPQCGAGAGGAWPAARPGGF